MNALFGRDIALISTTESLLKLFLAKRLTRNKTLLRLNRIGIDAKEDVTKFGTVETTLDLIQPMHSIVMGIRQQKGDVHLNFGLPITPDEIELASHCDKNDRYQAIRHAVDDRVIEGYRLWKNNYIAYDMVNHSYKYSDLYTPEDVEKFTNYVEQQLDKVEKSLNRSDLRDIFLKIYGNPVLSKEQLMEEKAAAAKQQ